MGKIIELPCDIGDSLYEIIVDKAFKEAYLDRYYVEDVSIKAIKFGDYWVDRSELGKEVFLSKEIPEKIFEEMKLSDEYKDYTFF